MATGTVTTVEITHTSIKQVQWDWLSTAGGAAGDTTTSYYNGRVISAVFEPDGGGTQPTDLYDVVVNDADGYDVLAGQGANLSNAATVYKVEANLGAAGESKLTLSVTNAGNAKGGKVTLYIR